MRLFSYSIDNICIRILSRTIISPNRLPINILPNGEAPLRTKQVSPFKVNLPKDVIK
jgi:hypothetical protein